jgi:hypothetical protein
MGPGGRSGREIGHCPLIPGQPGALPPCVGPMSAEMRSVIAAPLSDGRVERHLVGENFEDVLGAANLAGDDDLAERRFRFVLEFDAMNFGRPVTLVDDANAETGDAASDQGESRRRVIAEGSEIKAALTRLAWRAILSHDELISFAGCLFVVVQTFGPSGFIIPDGSFSCRARPLGGEPPGLIDRNHQKPGAAFGAQPSGGDVAPDRRRMRANSVGEFIDKVGRSPGVDGQRGEAERDLAA